MEPLILRKKLSMAFFSVKGEREGDGSTGRVDVRSF